MNAVGLAGACQGFANGTDEGRAAKWKGADAKCGIICAIGADTKHIVQCGAWTIEVTGEAQKNVAWGACFGAREAEGPERTRRGTVPSSLEIAASSSPGGVKGHAVAGGELPNPHEAVEGGTSRSPNGGVQWGSNVEG